MSVNKAMKRVLVTGSAGAIGSEVCKELRARGHFVRGFDRMPSSHAHESIVGEISDFEAVHAAAGGVDALVHLAAFPNIADYHSVLLPSNAAGLHNACEAARLQGVARLILTSSVQVVGHLTQAPRPVRLADPPRASNHYALLKIYAEEMGRMYAVTYGMSVLVVRPAWLPRDRADTARMLKSEFHCYSNYLSPGDAGRCFACGVEAELPLPGRCETVFAVSRTPPPALPWLDPAPAKETIGFEARDTWPTGVPFLEPGDLPPEWMRK